MTAILRRVHPAWYYFVFIPFTGFLLLSQAFCMSFFLSLSYLAILFTVFTLPVSFCCPVFHRSKLNLEGSSKFLDSFVKMSEKIK